MSTAASQALVQKLYVAYYGRPADPAGLEAWALAIDANKGQVSTAIVNAFGASAESTALFGNMSTSQKVNAIYKQLFGRDAEPAGLLAWATAIDGGRVSAAGAALEILNGAAGDDKTTINNKLSAAAAFTAALDTTAEITAYSGDTVANAARSFLAGVTTAAPSTDAVNTAVASVTNTSGSGSNEAGKSYVLTTAQDVLTGTNSGDFFRAVAGVDVNKQDQTTLNSSDIIDGGAGADTLIVNMTGPSYNGGARIKAVETLQIGTNQTTGFALNTASATFDYNVNAGSNEVTEVTTIVYDQINGTVGGAEEVLAVNNILKTGDNLPRLHWKNEAGSTAGEILANYRSSAVAGDTKQAITLENVTAPVIDTTKGNMTIAAGVETFAITSSGSGTNTLNNATGNTPLNGVAVDLVSGNNNTNLTKVVVDGAAGFGKKATVVTLNTDNDYGLTNRAVVGSDLGVDYTTADTTGVVRGAASNLVSVATSVTEYDASAATGAQAMRFTARTDGVATNVTFKGGAAADYAEFELGNVNATGGAGDDTFAFINTTANSSFGEGDTLVGGDGADTLQIGVNGNAQTYNISETELRNKTSFGTIDLRGSTTNLTLSSDFVAAADTANSIVVRTDKIIQTSDTDSANSSTVLTNNGLENPSTHTVNLTKLGSGQSVSFLGGSGSDRLILSDATFNVLKTLDGGVYNDSTVRAAGTNRYDTITVVTNGENVVIDGQDLSNVKNFEGFTLTKNANAATYNVTLTQAFLTNNTQATDNTNTAILDQVFRIGTANAANNRALAAGDTVTINVADLLNTDNTALASGWSSDRKLDITSLEQAGVTVNFVGNTGAAVTVATLRTLGAVLANGGDANTADVTTLSAANPGSATSLFFQGTAADETVTLVQANNSVDMGGGTDTINVGTLAVTGTLNGGTGSDTIVMGVGANLAGATIQNVESFTMAGTGSMTAAQYNAFTSGATAGSGADVLTITDAGTITGDADIETITFGLAGSTNQITLAGATTQAINGNTGADTVVTSIANSANKTIALGTGTDILSITDAVAANWSLATAGAAGAAVTGAETVNLQAGINTGATLTMFNGAATVNLTTGLVATQNGGVIALGTGGQTVNITGGSTGVYTITANTGSDSLNLTAPGGAVTFAVTPANSLVTAFDTITGFRAGTDKIDTTTAVAANAFTAQTVATADVVGLATALASAVTAAKTAAGTNWDANGDTVLVTISAGTAAGTYVVHNEGAGSTAFDATEDLVVKLVGTVGVLTAADII